MFGDVPRDLLKRLEALENRLDDDGSPSFFYFTNENSWEPYNPDVWKQPHLGKNPFVWIVEDMGEDSEED